jgi:hypothetical protein
MLLSLLAIGSNAMAIDFDYLKINEIFPAPDGTDAGLEWVELYNTAFHDVYLDGCVLERAKGSWAEVVVLSGVVYPGSTYLVADPDVAADADHRLAKGETLDLGNAGSNADGVRLVCTETDTGSTTTPDTGSSAATGGVVRIIDTVLYGSNNDDGLADDGDAPALVEHLAAKPSDGDSLARNYDGDDTDNSFVDFCKDDTPSPGEWNTCGGDSGTDTGGDTGVDTGDTGPVTGPIASCVDPVTINELRSNPAGTDTDLEWVELYNSGATDIDLTGWGLTWGTSVFKTPVELVGTIPAGGFFLVGGELVPDTDQLIAVSLGNAGSSSDALQLSCADGVADTVIYGEPNSDNWTNDLGELATSLGSVCGDDQCLARKENGVDTDATGDDFWVTTGDECTPGAANAVFTCDVDGIEHIRLNEIVADPEGSDTDAEWVELHNGGDIAVRLDRWALEGAKSSWAVQATLPSELELAPGGFLVIGGPLAGTVDVEASIDLGNAGSNGDGVRLVACDGTVVDTVIYGENNDDGLEDDSGGAATTLAPEMSDGESIARYPDGADTDLHNDDWKVCGTPSPGAENAECTGGGGGVVGESPDGRWESCGCSSRNELPESDVADAAGAVSPACSTVTGGSTFGWALILGFLGFRRRRD